MENYLINLDRAPERLEATRRLFESAGLSFTRVPGVDAQKLSSADLKRLCPPFRFYIANAHRAKGGDIACTQSHRKCWKTAFAGKARLAAVFEDDVDFDPQGLKEALAAVEKENDPRIPTVWLLHKGLPRPANPQGRWYNLRDADDVAHSWCSHCYAINAAAAAMLEEMHDPMANVLDSWSTYARLGVRVLVACEPCAWTRKEQSQIPRKPNRLWSAAWFRKLYWMRYKAAFRIDLLLKRLSGKAAAMRRAAKLSIENTEGGK